MPGLILGGGFGGSGSGSGVDTEGFDYSFSRAELSVGRRVFTKIKAVNFDQPTTSAAVMGSKPEPLGETEGEMGLGAGSIDFSEEGERMSFLEELGDGYRSVKWRLKWILTAKGKRPITLECNGCRVLSNPFAHAQGVEALAGTINFSAVEHLVNGLKPHAS